MDFLWISYGFSQNSSKSPFFFALDCLAAEATKSLVIPARVHQPLETRNGMWREKEASRGIAKRHILNI